MPERPASARSAAADEGERPTGAGIVLGTLILVAAVANLDLAVANVALPSIGQAFNASHGAYRTEDGVAATRSATTLEVTAGG